MEPRNTLTGVAVSETMETATRIVDEIESGEAVIGSATRNQTTTGTTVGVGERMEGQFSYTDIYNYVWKKEYPSSLPNKEDKQALRKRSEGGYLYYIGGKGKYNYFYYYYYFCYY